MATGKLGNTYIRAWREKKRLSLRRAVDRMEFEPGGDPLISHVSLSRIERGIQPYSQPILEALSEALGVSKAALLEWDPDKEGEVVDLLQHLDERKRAEAIEYLRYLAQR